MSKLLDQLAKEQTAQRDAKKAATVKAHEEEARQSQLYLVDNELLNARLDLDALQPALDQAKELRARIAEIEKRKKALER
jgi:hypothetical protein